MTVFSGNIIFGKMTELDILTECDFVRLSDLYDKYKDDIPPSDILYVVVTNGLSGTILIADIPNVGYGIYLQKPQVMPDTQKNHCGNSGLLKNYT